VALNMFNENNRFRVIIFGHSYVRRLNDFINSSTRFGHYRPGLTGTNLQLAQCCVSFLGVSGLNLTRIQQSDNLLAEIAAFRPDLIILQIGGNDLCKSFNSAGAVASDILKLASFLHQCNQCRVFISQLIPRFNCPAYYNSKVQDCNFHLATYLAPNNGPIRLWKHRGIWNSTRWLYNRDGVHFNDDGEFKLFNSYRAATLLALNSN